jgi:hypothetical protein
MAAKRHRCFVRIRRVGVYWKAYYGRTVDRFLGLDDDLAALVASCAASFPGDEIQMPPEAVVAAGLPPTLWDAATHALEWLKANPSANPALLQTVTAALAAALEF